MSLCCGHRYNSLFKGCEDVIIWSDEASVQLEMHKRHCYRNVGERPTPKPRPKHPIKVHVWAGISTQKEQPKFAFFKESWMLNFTTHILEHYLVPFIQDKFPGGTHCFMQDNDPNIHRDIAHNFVEANQIN